MQANNMKHENTNNKKEAAVYKINGELELTCVLLGGCVLGTYSQLRLCCVFRQL